MDVNEKLTFLGKFTQKIRGGGGGGGGGEGRKGGFRWGGVGLVGWGQGGCERNVGGRG